MGVSRKVVGTVGVSRKAQLRVGVSIAIVLLLLGADSLIIPNGFVKFLKQLIKRQTPPVLLETLPLIYKVS